MFLKQFNTAGDLGLNIREKVHSARPYDSILNIIRDFKN
jgi:hypothetical protein